MDARIDVRTCVAVYINVVECVCMCVCVHNIRTYIFLYTCPYMRTYVAKCQEEKVKIYMYLSNVRTYIYIYTYLVQYLYIHILKARERERERDRGIDRRGKEGIATKGISRVE